MKELKIEARKENLDSVIQFVDEILEEAGCQMKVQFQIDVAVEEIFVNIANYAYTPNIGGADISVDIVGEKKTIIITFKDSGVPYNPLLKPDPDVTLSVEDRQVGGLGIFMVKKSMDDMSYEYKDGKNILTIKKNILS